MPLVALEAMSDTHGTPTEGMGACTMEDITAEDQNYVEYQTAPSMKWHPALYAQSVVQQLLDTQFDSYIEGVQKADCEAELRRRLGVGPPVYIADKHAMPVPDGDTHICQLWFQSDGVERSAKLKGAKEGADRQALWDELKMVQGAVLAAAKSENGVDGAQQAPGDAAGGSGDGEGAGSIG